MRFWCTYILLNAYLHFALAAKNPQYPASEIPDSLKKNAGAVVRYNNVSIDIQDIHGYSCSEEKVITILNTSKEDEAVVKVWYNDRDVIKTFRAWLYDADGNEVKHLDKRDAEDYDANPGYVLAGTARAKVLDLRKLKPPFTIRYISELECRGTFHLPAWEPAATTGLSIEHANFKLSTANDMPVNYLAQKVINVNSDSLRLHWEINGFPALKEEEYQPNTSHLLPAVYLMAKRYEIYGFTGSSNTWNDIGLFMNKLMNGREVLRPEDCTALNSILQSTTDTVEVIKRVYGYLQNNFRYVCVSLGIGGWQPQEAAFTMEKKYGDCKALSFVMRAMLKKAGIESCLVLVHADNEGLDLKPDFPHSYFNHAILCVPLPNDTIWLECTSQTDPFNYLGSFTANRRALMVYEGGATVVKTPKYTEYHNRSNLDAHIKLNDDNSVSVQASIVKEGELQDNLRYYVSTKDARNTESAVYSSSHIKNMTIGSYKVTEVDTDKPRLAYTLALTGEGAVKRTEARMFVQTGVFAPLAGVPAKNENRKQQVKVGYGFTQSDTLLYALPIGYEPENFKPEDAKEVITKYGSANYEVQYSSSTGELRLIRKFILKSASYPAEEFGPFREFLLQANKTTCPELVLRKTGN